MNKKKIIGTSFLLASPLTLGFVASCLIGYFFKFTNFASIYFLYSVIWFVLFVYWFDNSEYQAEFRKKPE